ncbi:ABC transporter permease subunit/CPBP intramembrane protease [Aeoliella mucimassa]|uniref:ABC-2 family transporter protein n=1 Tax=Aeoliella mucimassa TaxID=2527972 RepID=A0A518AP48_9BACT|nr:ABC transporter permease subunit/CPBP intramembrane protease [Aeoliella mucimassa]QDU56471.1 ABC-2 family transporter protein [Aeoliella mucimassa]
MNWDNVKLVWQREIRDQLRDRRTLFVICVLPLMIYPMIGVTFSRMSQFVRQHDATVTVVGYEQLADRSEYPALVSEGKFATELFDNPKEADRIKVHPLNNSENALADARQLLESGSTDLVVHFPDGFAARLDQLREATEKADPTATLSSVGDPPNPKLYYNTEDASQVARGRVQMLLARWQGKIVQSNLAAGRLPLDVTRPFEVKAENVAPEATQQASFWAKLLPFIVFICALTGAFYPAVDLCAGEKERGTLETLLTSPAARNEIVGGKLLTVITFSIGSALCNLASMAFTSQIIINQLNQIAPAGEMPLAAPSLVSIGWLLVALVPMSVVFSAASLALASLAGSTKEGQYYLMPLFLVCMPLMLLPMMPGVELTLATSMVPISGMVLLMQAAMEGKLLLAATYVLPVLVVTFGCCALAIRWAIDQFNQESVLFRDAENFDLITWVRYSYRHRPETPKLGAAVALISLILMAQFLSQSVAIDLQAPGGFEKILLLSQLLCILLPTLVVAYLSSSSLRSTFLLKNPIPWKSIVIAGLLAVAMVPLGTALMELIVYFVPVSSELMDLIAKLGNIEGGPGMSVGKVLLLMAVMPAIIEEFAFRGVILSGFRNRLPAVWAVVLTAISFGVVHATALQQTISAGFLGLVLGYIAVKSKQITPCIAFHMGYNGLQLLRTIFASDLDKQPWAHWVFRQTDSPVVGLSFTPWVLVLMALAAIALLWQFGHHHRQSAGTLGLQDSGSSPMPTAAPAEESGA